MAPLPPRYQIYPWLRYQVEWYTKDIVHKYEQRLEEIFSRLVNRVHVLDFAGLTEAIRQSLAGRLGMVYTGDEGQKRQAPEKVNGVDLFYLRSMERGTANVPHLLAQYLFRHAGGKKSGASLFGGHFVHELRQIIVGLRGDVDRSITDQGRFTTWMVSCMTQLMDASGRTYQAFDSTLVGSSQLPYQRCTRRKTDDASTSAP
nr:hypothetical protein [Tanacetum cinerariifolium]